MTFTHRQTPIGAAATAAAALPAAAAADVANGQVMVDPSHRFSDVVVGRVGRKWRDWIGRHDFIETVRALDEAELIADQDLVDFRETA
jgi:hypothetical protein